VLRSTVWADVSEEGHGPISRDDRYHIKEHMEVIGADGVHVSTVDKVEGGRSLLKRIAAKAFTKATSTSSKKLGGRRRRQG
jgi:hypothetical protein